MSNPINPGSHVGSLDGDMGGRLESAKLQMIADTGVCEVQTLTFVAKASTGAADFVIIDTAGGNTVAIWLNKAGNDTEPSGPLYTATDDQIEVNISGVSTAAEVATAVFNAIDGNIEGVTAANPSSGVVRLTQDLMGNVAAPVPKSANESTAGSIVGATSTAGADSNYNEKYFTFKNGSNSAYYVWFNVNDEGTDPAQTGTGVEIAVAASASADTIADAVAAAVDAISGMNCDHEGNGVVVITSEANANVTDASAGDAPVTVLATQQGSTKRIDASASPSSISNNPSVI